MFPQKCRIPKKKLLEIAKVKFLRRMDALSDTLRNSIEGKSLTTKQYQLYTEDIE